MADIYIYDDIGPEWLGMVSAKAVIDQIKAANGGPIEVKINSGGGSVMEALAIYNAMTAHQGELVVSIDGVAASSASYLAMAGKRIKIAENAKFMIHNAWTVTVGDSIAHQKTADVLGGFNQTLAEAYAKRSGKSVSEVLQKMADETWFSAKEAVDFGLADEIGQKLQVKASIAPGRFLNTPQDLINPEKPKEYAHNRNQYRAKSLLTPYNLR